MKLKQSFCLIILAVGVMFQINTISYADNLKEDKILVNSDNFLDYFSVNGDARWDSSNERLYLTQPGDMTNTAHAGNATLKNKVDMNADFILKGEVLLGTLNKPYQNDGIGFGFHQGLTSDVGSAGPGMGIMGLQNSFGFKFDSWVNNNIGDPNFSNGLDGGEATSFGGFITSDDFNLKNTSSDILSTNYTDKDGNIINLSGSNLPKPIDKYNITPENLNVYNAYSLPNGNANLWVPVTVAYNGQKKLLSVIYNNDNNFSWILNVEPFLTNSTVDKDGLSFLMSASNFSSQNGQGFRFGTDGYFLYSDFKVVTSHFINNKEDLTNPIQESGKIGSTLDLEESSKNIISIEKKGDFYLKDAFLYENNEKKNNFDFEINKINITQNKQDIFYNFVSNQSEISTKDLTLKLGQNFNYAMLFENAKNADGTLVDFSELQIDKNVEENKPGEYKVKFSYTPTLKGFRNNSLPIVESEAKLNIVPNQVTARFVDQDGKELADPVVQTGRIGDAYAVGAQTIEGYALDLNQVPTNATGTYTKDDITVTYVYKKVDAPAETTGQVTARFVDQDGEKLIDSVVQTGRIGDAYAVGAQTIEGYALDLDQAPTNATGTYTKDGITVTYVYKKVDAPAETTGQVTARFVDQDGKELADPVVQTGRIGDAYAVGAQTIEGYALDLDQAPTNATGTYTKDGITVTYVYKKVDAPAETTGQVTARFVDQDGKELADPVVQTGRIGDAYAVGAQTIEGYALDLDQAPTNATGTYTKDGITVTYVYKKVDAPAETTGQVTARFVDQDGKELADPVVQTGRIGDAYAVGAQTIEGYALDLDQAPTNATGTYTKDGITVMYVYKKVDAPAETTGQVTARFVDQDGKELADPVVQTGRIGDAYAVGAQTIEGYALDLDQAPTNATGTYTKDGITVTYVYKKVDAPAETTGQVTARFVDQDGKELADPVVQTGRIGDAYAVGAQTIEGYALDLDQAPTNATGTYTKDGITVTYVYKKVDAPAETTGQVTARFVDQDGKELADPVVQTGRIGDAYAVGAQTIEGYALDLDQAPTNATGTYTKDGITVMYVYKKVDAPAETTGQVTARFVDQDGKELADPVVQTGRIGDAYAVGAQTIEGYALDLDQAPTNATGTYTKDGITVTYVYKKVDAPAETTGQVTARFVDQDGKELADPVVQTGRIGDAYAVGAQTIEGYALDLDQAPTNATGTYTKDGITVTYVYKKVDAPAETTGQVTARFVDQDGKELADPVVQTGRIGDAYAVGAQTIEGYALDLDQAPTNATGTYTKDGITVTYVYKKVDAPAETTGQVTARFVDQDGKELADPVVQTGRIGDAYAVGAQTIEGYALDLDQAPTNATGTYTKDGITVTYVYKKVDAPAETTGQVTARFVDQDGKELADPVVQTGRIGDAYAVGAQTIEGYALDLDQAPTNATGTYTKDGITVMYVYKKVDAPAETTGQVTARFVDQDGKELADPVVQTGRIGDAYAVGAQTIEGYALDLDQAPTNATGTYTKDGITVTYVYKKVDAPAETTGQVTARFVDQDGKELADPVVQTGRIGDAYAVGAQTIEGYALDLDQAPTNATGTYTKDGITVMYVYKKVDAPAETTGQVTARFVDQDGKELADPVVQTGRIGDAYAVGAQTIEGYALDLDQAPTNATGTYTKDGITVTYVYKKVDAPAETTGQVTARFVDQDGKELADPVVQTGRIGDAYAVGAQTIEGYALDLDQAPTNATGTYTKDGITVTYVYKKVDAPAETTGQVTARFVDQDGKELADPVVQTGRIGDAYAVGAQTIEGYALDLDQAPTNATGTYTKDGITVMYVYKKVDAPAETTGQVTARFVDQDGKELADPVVQTGRIGDAYAVGAQTIEGYALDLDQAPTNATGTYTKDGITVTYVYKKVDAPAETTGQVTARFVDQDGKELADPVVQTGRIGDAYAVGAQTIEGYALDLDQAPTNATGTYTKDGITVMYVYKKVDAPAETTGQVTARFVDQDGKELADPVVQTGRIGDAYAVGAQTIEGYALDLDQAPTNATGTYTKDGITVMYVYKKVRNGNSNNNGNTNGNSNNNGNTNGNSNNNGNTNGNSNNNGNTNSNSNNNGNTNTKMLPKANESVLVLPVIIGFLLIIIIFVVKFKVINKF
ncbi:MucBP domain-containing protein [Enterococcus sp. AZ102]|uniref:MucBP domain-containing protein n=1 Tax=Enterococcus sp. AZ102 TaxID=2774865 RepID=UPI003F268F11